MMNRIDIGLTAYSVAEHSADSICVWNAYDKDTIMPCKVFRVKAGTSKSIHPSCISLRANSKNIVCTGGVKGLLALAQAGEIFAPQIAKVLNWAWFNTSFNI